MSRKRGKDQVAVAELMPEVLAIEGLAIGPIDGGLGRGWRQAVSRNGLNDREMRRSRLVQAGDQAVDRA